MASNLQVSGTTTLKISLSHHTDKFCPDSQELAITKQVNFIFGKNGTGKTTISDEILSQLSTDYDVCVFKDFDGVVENDRLNAVALGTDNAKIQKEIDIIDGKIAEINKQIKQPENKNAKNIFTRAKESKGAYEKQERKIDMFFTDSARTIKNISSPQVAKTTYDKGTFKHDIAKANLLPEERRVTHINTLKTDKMPDAPDILFPDMDLLSHLESTNEILQSRVDQTQDIPDLTGKTDKQNFARQGMGIHEHKAGEICAFCGNEITDERWLLLGNYFNYEVKTLEGRIASEIEKIDAKLKTVKKIEKIEKGTKTINERNRILKGGCR